MSPTVDSPQIGNCSITGAGRKGPLSNTPCSVRPLPCMLISTDSRCGKFSESIYAVEKGCIYLVVEIYRFVLVYSYFQATTRFAILLAATGARVTPVARAPADDFPAAFRATGRWEPGSEGGCEVRSRPERRWKTRV